MCMIKRRVLVMGFENLTDPYNSCPGVVFMFKESVGAFNVTLVVLFFLVFLLVGLLFYVVYKQKKGL